MFVSTMKTHYSINSSVAIIYFILFFGWNLCPLLLNCSSKVRLPLYLIYLSTWRRRKNKKKKCSNTCIYTLKKGMHACVLSQCSRLFFLVEVLPSFDFNTNVLNYGPPHMFFLTTITPHLLSKQKSRSPLIHTYNIYISTVLASVILR